MTDKNKRLRELAKIPPFARVDHRHHLNEKGELPYVAKLPRAERRKLATESEKLVRQYGKILKSLATSGAGFPTDQLLRQMATEYTHRYASSGTNNQPVSFNYFEPFLHIKLIQTVAPYTELVEEFDHLFYASDFFDYLTSPDSDGFDLESLYELREEKTFHFSANGNVADISFLNGENKEFLVSGFSMIRRGNSLYWYLIGGEVLGEDEWEIRCSKQPEIDLQSINPSKRAFLRESIEESNFRAGPPLPLEGTSTAIRTIIAGEIDIKTKKHLARCHMTEYENAFPVFCDDPEIHSSIEDEEKREATINHAMNYINKSAVLWNLAEGFLQLPNYFRCRLPLDKEVLAKSRKRLSQKKGGRGINKSYKVVSAIEVTDAKPASTILRIDLPHYATETEGHWRRLPQGAIGYDRNGSAVIEKTWVNSSSKWKAPKTYSRTIFVKDTIESAKLKISEYLKVAKEIEENATANSNTRKQNHGELYVMRCAGMKETIFKVGFTEGNSNERAEQLSSATGVPLSFVVVRSWQHPDAEALETEVHMMLAPYRVNDGREFFLVRYDVIENIIETTIARLENS